MHVQKNSKVGVHVLEFVYVTKLTITNVPLVSEMDRPLSALVPY